MRRWQHWPAWKIFCQVFRALQVLLQGAPTREGGGEVPGEEAAEEAGVFGREEDLQEEWGQDRCLCHRSHRGGQVHSIWTVLGLEVLRFRFLWNRNRNQIHFGIDSSTRIGIQYGNRFQYSSKKIDFCCNRNWNHEFLNNDENPIPIPVPESKHLYLGRCFRRFEIPILFAGNTEIPLALSGFEGRVSSRKRCRRIAGSAARRSTVNQIGISTRG